MNPSNIVIAIDGTSASGKSTNARLVAQALGYIYVDTGAMYRTLAWHCLRHKIDVHDGTAVWNLCRQWKTTLACIEHKVLLLVNGYYPETEIRTATVSAAVSHVAAVPKVPILRPRHSLPCACAASSIRAMPWRLATS